MNSGQQLRWQEPWLFSLRMRSKRGWKLKGWLIVAIYAAMMIGWYLDQHYGKGLKIGFNGAVILCCFIAVFLGFLSDLGISEVQITDDGVGRAFYGHLATSAIWRYQDIRTFCFISHEHSGKSFGILVLTMDANIIMIGVPSQISKSKLIEFFRRYEIQETQAFALGDKR